MGGHRCGKRLPQTRMGQHEVVIDLEQHQVLAQSILFLHGVALRRLIGVALRRLIAAPRCRRLKLSRSTNDVLICQPQAANTCSPAVFVPNTTRCFTLTRHRRRRVLTTCT